MGASAKKDTTKKTDPFAGTGKDTDVPSVDNTQDTNEPNQKIDPFAGAGSDKINPFAGAEKKQEAAADTTDVEGVSEKKFLDYGTSQRENKPPIKFKEPSQVEDSELLKETKQQLDLGDEKSIERAELATAEPVSTRVDQPAPQELKDINLAKENISRMVEGYDDEPQSKRLRLVESVGEVYDKEIESLKEKGQTEEADRLKKESGQLKRLREDLLQRETQDYYDDSTFLQRWGRYAKKGFISLLQQWEARHLANDRRLELYKMIDEGNEKDVDFSPTTEPGPTGFGSAGEFAESHGIVQEYKNATPEERQQLKQGALDDFAETAADIKDYQQSIASIPSSPTTERALQATSFNEFFDMFMKDPLGVAIETTVTSGPALVPMLGAATVTTAVTGNPYLGATAAGGTSAMMQYGMTVLSELQREGVDVEDEDALRKAVENGDLMARVKEKAKNASAIRFVGDTFAFGLGGTRLLPKNIENSVASIIGREAGEEVLQVGSQGLTIGGTTAGVQLATEGEISRPGEVVVASGARALFAPLTALGMRKAVRMNDQLRARKAIIDYSGIKSDLRALRAERIKRVEQGNAARIMEIDKLSNELNKALPEIGENQLQRIAQRINDLERSLTGMEKRRGAKATSSDQFKLMLEEVEAGRRILAEHGSGEAITLPDGTRVLTKPLGADDGIQQPTQQARETARPNQQRASQEAQQQGESQQAGAGEQASQSQTDSNTAGQQDGAAAGSVGQVGDIGNVNIGRGTKRGEIVSIDEGGTATIELESGKTIRRKDGVLPTDDLGTPTMSKSHRGANLPSEGNLRAVNKVGDKHYVGDKTDTHATLSMKHNLDPELIESGFIDSKGNYLNRNEAAKYADQNNVKVKGKENSPPNMLLADQIAAKKTPPAKLTDIGFKVKPDEQAAQAQRAKEKAEQGESGEAAKFGSRNLLVSKERYQQVQNEIRELGGQLNAGVDPKMLKLMGEAALYNIEAGVRSFADFAKTMKNEYGEQVVPHLRKLYNDARDKFIKQKEGADEGLFSEKADIDRTLLDYQKNPDDASFTIDEANDGVRSALNVEDTNIRSQVRHSALTDLAKSYQQKSTDVNYLLDFIDKVQKDYPGNFNKSEINSAWTASLSNISPERSFGFAGTLAYKSGVNTETIGRAYDAGLWLEKKMVDSFADVRRVQEEIESRRGGDFFRQNRELDARLLQTRNKGIISEIQRQVTDVSNPESSIRRILQILDDNDIQRGPWKEYYERLERAKQFRSSKQFELANEQVKKAIELDPNKGGKPDDFQLYLRARHAEEGNKYLAGKVQERIDNLQKQLDEIPDTPENQAQRQVVKGQLTKAKKEYEPARRGTGMTDKEAVQVMERLEKEGKMPALEEAATVLDDVTEKTLQQLEDGGLIGKEFADELRNRYDNYVPLNRVLFDADGGLVPENLQGKGSTVDTPIFKRTGSDRPVDEVMMNVIGNFDQVVQTAARNKLIQTLAKQYDYEYTLGNETLGRSVRKGTIDDDKFAQKIPYKAKKGDGTVEDRVLLFTEATKHSFDAMEGNGVIGWNNAGIRALGHFMNYLRTVRTSGSINFMISNPQRDVGTAMLNAASDFGYGSAFDIGKGMVRKNGRFADAQRSIWEHLRGEDTPGAREVGELKELGGTTGFYQFRGRNEILKDLRNVEKKMETYTLRKGEVGKNSLKRTKQVFNTLKEGLDNLNEIAENSTRLSAFRIAKENGLSKERAAQYALELTTNFNQSGDWGQIGKLGYQFANSAVQGHNRLARAAKTAPKTFAKTIGVLMSMGAMESAYNDFMNSEAYQDRQRNQPYIGNNKLSIQDADGKIQFNMYLPFGYNVFKAAGNHLYDLSMGYSDPETAASRIGEALGDSFNPFRGSRMFTGGIQGLITSAFPTVLKPAREIDVNDSFFGPIYPQYKEALQEQTGTPDYQLKYPTVNPYVDYVTTWLAANTDEAIDVSPETIEHMGYFLGGSVGREWMDLFTKSINTDNAVRDGYTLYEKSDGTRVKIMPNEIPIVNRFIRTVDRDRQALTDIYRLSQENMEQSFDFKGEEFQGIVEEMRGDYETLLDNKGLPEDQLENSRASINAFVRSVYKNNEIDKAIEHFKERGWVGEKYERRRQRYYEGINRRATSVRIPQLYRKDEARIREVPYAETKSTKILGTESIQTIEDNVNFDVN